MSYAQYNQGRGHGPYVGATGKDISRPAELNMTVFLSPSAAFGGWVLVLIGSLMVGGQNWKKNEGGINFLVYCGAFFYFNSLLLITMSEILIRGLPTPQEAATVAARESAMANAALAKGVATKEVLAELQWDAGDGKDGNLDTLKSVATYYVRKKIAADRRAAAFPTVHSCPWCCCQNILQAETGQYRWCRLLATAIAFMFSICCLHFLSKELDNAFPAADSEGQAERDLCMMWGILFVVSQICTWTPFAYDVFYLGSIGPFFDTWPEDDGRYPEDIVKEELRKADTTQQRLEQLEQLREKGLVNDSEYQQKKEEIVLQIEAAQNAGVILTKIWDDHDEEMQKNWEKCDNEDGCCP